MGCSSLVRINHCILRVLGLLTVDIKELFKVRLVELLVGSLAVQGHSIKHSHILFHFVYVATS